ncbi:MAG: beta-ketoacyl-[acyl-carrier-protein] synthase family protein [Chloroflexi bacterium]|nr:beta-ketoacyl-[acyl-carrier-protein] synthase family protein [Chloroflexota bacterium]
MNWKWSDRCEHRVVVTGMGVLTRTGETLAEYLASLQAGLSGITQWKCVDTRIPLRVGGDMSDFHLGEHLARVGGNYPQELVERAQRLLGPAPLSGRLTAAAAMQAFTDAGLAQSRVASERVAHVLAGSNLNQQYIQESVLACREEPEYVDPLFGLLFLDTDVLSVISEILGVRGPSFTVGGASASGNLALLSAIDQLRAGRAEAALVSGGACIPDSTVLQGWVMLDALATRSFNAEPWRASRPFDSRREGFVPSEGAAAVVLETYESARARSARIYAEVLGAASTSDVSRSSIPNADGQAWAMQAALADASLDPEEINYVNAHATSSRLGDAVEVNAIKTVFGEHAYDVPVNATKSMTGHCLSAAGIVEFVATILQMEHGFVHPTINLEEPDPELDLDFVPKEARDYRIEYALSNSFGFGGLNASVVIGRAS